MPHCFKVVRSSLFCIFLVCTAGILVSSAQTHEETSLWESVKDSKDANDYRAYLDKYPDGVYAPLAKRRIAQLNAHPSEQTPASEAETKKALDTKQLSSKPQGSAPVTMTECEGTNNCATWTFLGTQGNGQWPSGEVANLTVEHFDADNVLIHRADSTGSSAGLTALYKGTRHGDRVGGGFTSSWPGHWENKSGDWYATLGKAPQSPPSVMHWCAQHCTTLIWQDGHYGSEALGSVWTVESFTQESVIMNRTDYRPYPGKAVLTGKISRDGNRITNGTITWTYHPCCGLSSGTFNAAWGTAIDTLPGSDGPAPSVIQRPVVCYPWFFTMVCQ